MQKDPSISTIDQAVNAVKQQDVIEIVDDEVDLTPHTQSCGYRDYEKAEPIIKSVVKPGLKQMLPKEKDVDVPLQIDYDCDQVRAMISRFTQDGEWTLDQFRQALGYGNGGFGRPQLMNFLDKSGPRGGDRQAVYLVAWEFFKKVRVVGE